MDYASLIPHFDNVLPEFLDKKNRFLLASDRPAAQVKPLEDALKGAGYDVATVTCGSETKTGPDATCLAGFKEHRTNACVAVIMTRPEGSVAAIQAAMAAGIDRIWLDTGSETSEAIAFLRKAPIQSVYQTPLAREALNQPASDATKYDRKDS